MLCADSVMCARLCLTWRLFLRRLGTVGHLSRVEGAALADFGRRISCRVVPELTCWTRTLKKVFLNLFQFHRGRVILVSLAEVTGVQCTIVK